MLCCEANAVANSDLTSRSVRSHLLPMRVRWTLLPAYRLTSDSHSERLLNDVTVVTSNTRTMASALR